MTYHNHSHPIKTNFYKPLYLDQILMDLAKVFSLRPQWSKRPAVTLKLTQQQLPWGMIYYGNSHPIKTNTYKFSFIDKIVRDLQNILRIGPQ